ncbi:uncharacterized protein [Physcomitrium patens]|uniref:uncharacterized protein n=1 Tax=Physcomitrium patens TaxID=3218 RepID=UPI003CCCE031
MPVELQHPPLGALRLHTDCGGDVWCSRRCEGEVIDVEALEGEVEGSGRPRRRRGGNVEGDDERRSGAGGVLEWHQERVGGKARLRLRLRLGGGNWRCCIDVRQIIERLCEVVMTLRIRDCGLGESSSAGVLKRECMILGAK